MKFTATQIEDFHVEERKFLCGAIDLRKVLLAQGWERLDKDAPADRHASKFKRNWETLAVDKRTDAGIWMWYRYNSAKMGGTLYDRINPDTSQLPHGDNADKIRSMEKVLKQNSLRQFAKQFVSEDVLKAFYIPRKGIIAASIEQGEKILKGELSVSAQRESLLDLAIKFGFKKTEMKGPRQFFEFTPPKAKVPVIISVPVNDPYVYIEHGEKRIGGGVRGFKERYAMMRQLDFEGKTKGLPKVENTERKTPTYLERKEEPVSMAAEPQPVYQAKFAPLQGDLFQDLGNRSGMKR